MGCRSTALHSAERREDEGVKDKELRIIVNKKWAKWKRSDEGKGRARVGNEIVEEYISGQKGLEKAGAARGAREDERGR